MIKSPLMTAIVLLFATCQAIPAERRVKRQDIGTAQFTFDTNHCKREQSQKDLITTELGVATAMAKAAAGAALNADNKWSGYFFDDDTNSDPDASQVVYQRLGELQDDTNYNVKIYCPVEGDSAFTACKSGRTWASTFAFGTNKHITICPIWFDGIDDNTVKYDSSIAKTNCQKNAKGEKNWKDIAAFKGVKSFTMLHEMTHLNYATKSDGAAQNNRSLDFAYTRPNCKKLRDGTWVNQDLCKGTCPATKSFRNADTLAFIAAGIYWEKECDKTINIEPEVGVTENAGDDPVYNDDSDAGPNEPVDDGDGGSATTTAVDPPTTSPPAIGPLTDCSLVQTTIEGTIAGGPQTYCTCGSIIAGINTETSGSLVYSVCAGDPYPTVATSTIETPTEPTEAPAEPTESTVDLGECKNGVYSDSTCNDSCGPGTCTAASNALGTLYYYCDC